MEQTKHKALIIDDNINIASILKQLLGFIGFDVLYNEDPFEGIGLAVVHKPVLIFLDIDMPGITGDVAIKVLRGIEYTRKIPVIICSGSIDKNILVSTIKDGASGFIAKPFDAPTVTEKIKAALPMEILDTLMF